MSLAMMAWVPAQLMTTTQKVEMERVRRHLAGAEIEARKNHVDHDATTTEVRRLLLEELALYRAEGRFPKNRAFATSFMPCFIDDEGTRCAMAHLMEIGGASDLVQEIAAKRNYAFVRELADDARVIAWLEAAGLTVAEAARIQPTYCPRAHNQCVCTRVESTSLIVRGEIVMTEIRTASLANDDDDAGTQSVVVKGLRVAEISGTKADACSTLKVGDVLPASNMYEELADVGHVATGIARPGSSCTLSSVVLDTNTSDGVTTCKIFQPQRVPSALSAAELASAAASPDCEGALAAKDAAWNVNPKPKCSGDSVVDSSCSMGSPREAANDFTASGTAVTTVTILAAILAYRAAARRHRRRHYG